MYFIQIHPQWTIFHHFIVSEVQLALRTDVQTKTHPLTFYVESPEALENIFDDITYSKGINFISHSFLFSS